MSASYKFALEAQKQLGSGNATEAVRMLEEGLKIYPEYATAYTLLARAYVSVNDNDAALKSVQRGLMYVPANKALATLQESLHAVSQESEVPAITHDGIVGYENTTAQPKSETTFVPTEPTTFPSAFVLTDSVSEDNTAETIQGDGFSNIEDDSEDWLTANELTDDAIEDIIAEQLNQEERTEFVANHNPDIIQSDILSNIEDDTEEDWQTANELAEDVVEENIVEQLALEERIEEELNNNPDIIQSDILSNIEDDTEDWQTANELAEDVVEEKIIEQLAQEYRLDEILNNTPEVIQSDILSNIEDDTEEDWQTANELAEDEAIARILKDVSANAGVILPTENDVHNTSTENEGNTLSHSTDSLLEKIKLVGSEIRVHESVKELITTRHSVPYLRLIETAKGDKHAVRTLRSNNLRLIPGLDYTPLRIESSRKQQRHRTNVPEPPPFPAIRGSRMQQHMMPSFTFSPPPMPDLESSLRYRLGNDNRTNVPDPTRKLSPLEELAARLERARIPAVAEPDETPQPIAPPINRNRTDDIVVSETMALIYEKQGAFDQALRAYKQLIIEKPNRAEHFTQKIEQLLQRIEG